MNVTYSRTQRHRRTGSHNRVPMCLSEATKSPGSSYIPKDLYTHSNSGLIASGNLIIPKTLRTSFDQK